MERSIRVQRTARYYVAGDLATAREVWVVLHGYGQLAREFLDGFAALVAPGRAVIAPEALNRYYKDGGARGSHAETPVGATWMTREFREQDIADYVAYLDAVVRAERRDDVRLGVIGFSQGVATAIRWVALGASRFDRVVAWAGQLPHDVDVAAAAARFPASGVEFVVGDRDEFREWIGVEAQGDRLAAAGVAWRTIRFAGGHRIDDGALLELVAR